MEKDNEQSFFSRLRLKPENLESLIVYQLLLFAASLIPLIIIFKEPISKMLVIALLSVWILDCLIIYCPVLYARIIEVKEVIDKEIYDYKVMKEAKEEIKKEIKEDFSLFPDKEFFGKMIIFIFEFLGGTTVMCVLALPAILAIIDLKQYLIWR